MQRLLLDHNQRYVYRLSNALLTCPTVSHRDSLIAMLHDLPKHINTNLHENLPTLRQITRNLIVTCANYEEGEIELFRILGHYESNSLSFQSALAEWKKIKAEISEQERLIDWVKHCDIAFTDLHQIFKSVTPEDFAAFPRNIEGLIRDLWEVENGHESLLLFMQRLKVRIELKDSVRTQIETWCSSANKNHLLKIDENSPGVIDENKGNRIIVKIELSQQDYSRRLVTLWINKGGQLEMLNSFEKPVSQLENAVSDEIDTWTLAYAPIEIIEFYVPTLLINLPVDTWQFKFGLKQRFIDRYQVIKCILERQEARAIRLNLEQAISSEERRHLILALRNNPLMVELVRRCSDWEEGWKKLNQKTAHQFEDVTHLLSSAEELPPPKDKFFALFTFTPPEMTPSNLDDPITQLIIAGTPLMAWVRSIENTPENVTHIRQILFENHCNIIIRKAADIVTLMHNMYRKPVNPEVDTYKIRNKLNLIVDNPESKLPILDRVAM